MTDLFAEPEYATPLAPDEPRGLAQSWIATRTDLNEAEQANIADGIAWAHRIRRDIISLSFVKELHRRMLGDVWSWAGTFRKTPRNIGVDAYRVATALEILLQDTKYWIDKATYSADEIAVRPHHRLVARHPFPNGNGRHARLMADLLIRHVGGEPFSWGGTSLTAMSTLGRRYIDALQAADGHDIEPLLTFARS